MRDRQIAVRCELHASHVGKHNAGNHRVADINGTPFAAPPSHDHRCGVSGIAVEIQDSILQITMEQTVKFCFAPCPTPTEGHGFQAKANLEDRYRRRPD